MVCARDYDPVTGSWTAKDPLRFAGGDTDLYRYANGDPIDHIDPSGRWDGGVIWIQGAVEIGIDELAAGAQGSVSSGVFYDPTASGWPLTGGLYGAYGYLLRTPEMLKTGPHIADSCPVKESCVRDDWAPAFLRHQLQ